jgi:ABC-2 type transport system permease protein
MSEEHPTAVGWSIAAVIARRELVRFLRQPARVAASIGTPLLLWLFLGSGFAGGFRPAGLGDISYAAFLLPGAMTLVAVFAAIFSSISVIEDRNEGWLQAALVSPAPRWAIAMGKILGASAVAFAQAAILMLAMPFLDLHITISAALATLFALAATTFAMTSLGFIFAWHSETTASFHAVMNIVFMPMWLLSGAFVPPPSPDGGGGILSWLMRLNPLTWCTQAIRQPILEGRMSEPAWWWLVASILFALMMFTGAVLTVSRQTR